MLRLRGLDDRGLRLDVQPRRNLPNLRVNHDKQIPKRAESENRMEENLSMGREAFRIYDEKGEEAMLAYLIAHEKAGGQEDEWLYRLEDGSMIEFSLGPGGRYILADETEQPERPVTVDDVPPYFDRGIPMVPWPNSGSIMEDLLKAIAQDAADGEGSQERAKPDLYQALTAAPQLQAAIQQAMAEIAESSLPGRVLESLGEMQRECADRALELLSEEQRDALAGSDNTPETGKDAGPTPGEEAR